MVELTQTIGETKLLMNYSRTTKLTKVQTICFVYCLTDYVRKKMKINANIKAPCRLFKTQMAVNDLDLIQFILASFVNRNDVRHYS